MENPLAGNLDEIADPEAVASVRSEVLGVADLAEDPRLVFVLMFAAECAGRVMPFIDVDARSAR